MKNLRARTCLSFLFLLGSTHFFAQKNRLATELRFGMNVNLYNIDKFRGKPQKFSGIKVFGTAVITGTVRSTFQTNYAMSLVVYNKSLGNNMNPLISDIQVDFVNTVSLGVGWGGLKKSPLKEAFWQQNARVRYTKYLRTMNQAPYYNLSHNFRNSLFMSTNFVVNNHRRNQACGSATVTAGDFSINYYNDGSPPFSWFSLGDGFDRYWTGGAMLFGHRNSSHNLFEVSFDQFTGYRPLIYELSNLLGMRVPEYNGQKAMSSLNREGNVSGTGPSKRDIHSSSSFNSSAYHIKVYLDRNYAVDLGVIGSLIRKDKFYGIQDIIHLRSRMAMHPNRDINRYYLGLTYNQYGYGF